jgi:hypothetical protein
MEELLGHLHPPIIPERVNAIDPYIDKRWDCLNRSGGCYNLEAGKVWIRLFSIRE